MKTAQRIELEKQLAILIAWEAGERVQIEHEGKWLDMPAPLTPEVKISFDYKTRIVPKPRELWVVYVHADSFYVYQTKERAEELAKESGALPATRFVEVIE